MRMLPLLFLVLLAACADVRPGSPEACSLVQRGSFPIRIVERRPVVEVRINGMPATLLLDTGAGTTFITAAAAERLKLRQSGVDRGTSKGVGGESEAVPADIDSFEFAGLALPVHRVVLVPFEIRGSAKVDGLLGIDVLRQFDVEMDLQAGAGALYRPRNCPAARPPGLSPMASFEIPPTAAQGQLQIIVELNGRKVHGLLDTGSTTVLVDRRAALLAGATAEELSAARTITGHGAAPEDAKIAVHRFKSLRIGDARWANLDLPVAELPPSAGDMLIGMDFLRGRKLWISFPSRRVYISASQQRQ